MLKHYVERQTFDILVPNSYITEVEERNPAQIEPSEFCFRFRFFDRTEEVIDGETLTGKEKNVSGWYYFGQRMTLEEVNGMNLPNLISHMKETGLSAVRTKFNQFFLLGENDIVL